MSIKETIEHNIIIAMKAHNQEELDALRMARAALKNEEIALGHDVDEPEMQKVLQKLIKQRREAAEQYKLASRTNSMDKELREAALLEQYLPAQMDDATLKTIIQKVITETGAAGVADTGKVIGAVVKQTQGQADGTRISQLVRELL